MQVMPATARDPGFGIKAWAGGADDLARVGRDYRAAMQQRYDGDLAKMWAAYNWGPGNVDRALDRHGDAWLTAAPAETREYVRKNLRMVGR
jgi:soluble lytic murein transglycosylase